MECKVNAPESHTKILFSWVFRECDNFIMIMWNVLSLSLFFPFWCCRLMSLRAVRVVCRLTLTWRVCVRMTSFSLPSPLSVSHLQFRNLWQSVQHLWFATCAVVSFWKERTLCLDCVIAAILCVSISSVDQRLCVVPSVDPKCMVWNCSQDCASRWEILFWARWILLRVVCTLWSIRMSALLWLLQ